LSSQYARQWLDERSLSKAYAVGKKKYATIYVDTGQPCILSEPAWIEIRAPQGIANRVMTRKTMMTGITRHMMCNADAVAYVIALYFCSQGSNHTGNLMT
jgi:hypothetical protein